MESSIVRGFIPIRWGTDCIATWSSPNTNTKPNPNPNPNPSPSPNPNPR